MATESPFRMTENKQFKALIQTLRPGTEVPSRKYLSEKLLDDVYGEQLEGLLTAKIQIDGWSNIENIHRSYRACVLCVWGDISCQHSGNSWNTKYCSQFA